MNIQNNYENCSINLSLFITQRYISKGKGKIHPVTGHEGPDGV
jgi:hypothetical protein